jgi:hypothetical protein
MLYFSFGGTMACCLCSALIATRTSQGTPFFYQDMADGFLLFAIACV